MPDSASDGRGQREPLRDSGTSPAPVQSGLTNFLVADPATARVSREALSEAVRSLIRERDYLREMRDVQLAEHASELAEHRNLVKELRRLYGSERRAFREQKAASSRELASQSERAIDLGRERDEWRERAQELDGKLAAHRTQLAALLQEFDTYRAQTAALHPELADHRAQATVLLQELAAHRAQAIDLLQDRHALLHDRDAWRERASRAEAQVDRSLLGRVKRSLRHLVRRARTESSAIAGAASSERPVEP